MRLIACAGIADHAPLVAETHFITRFHRYAPTAHVGQRDKDSAAIDEHIVASPDHEIDFRNLLIRETIGCFHDLAISRRVDRLTKDVIS